MSQPLFNKVKSFVEQNCKRYSINIDITNTISSITIPFYPGKIKIFINNEDVKRSHVLYYISHENRLSEYENIDFDEINKLFRLMNDINELIYSTYS